MKKIIYATLTLVLLIGVYFAYINSYTQFRPVIFVVDSYKFIEVESDSLFYMNLKKVLNYSNVQYKTIENGEVLVKRKVFHDKELLLNYTRKAMDTAWIKSHGDQTPN